MWRALYCLTVMLLMFIAPINALAVTQSIPVINCAEEAESIDGLGATIEQIGILIGCRLDTDGNLFVPDGPTSDRLASGPILTNEERAATADFAKRLTDQLDAFDYWLQNTGYTKDQSLYDAMIEVNEQTNTGLIESMRNYYSEYFTVYFNDPETVLFQDYANWWFSRRVSIVDRMCLSLAPMWCTSLKNAYLQLPWPWQLNDSISIAEYLKWALENGRIPSNS